jgi:hypothetical protein
MMIWGVVVNGAGYEEEIGNGLSSGETKSIVWSGRHSGICFSSIDITNWTQYYSFKQSFNIWRCGNLGVVIKFYNNAFYIEKYPY